MSVVYWSSTTKMSKIGTWVSVWWVESKIVVEIGKREYHENFVSGRLLFEIYISKRVFSIERQTRHDVWRPFSKSPNPDLIFSRDVDTIFRLWASRYSLVIVSPTLKITIIVFCSKCMTCLEHNQKPDRCYLLLQKHFEKWSWTGIWPWLLPFLMSRCLRTKWPGNPVAKAEDRRKS